MDRRLWSLFGFLYVVLGFAVAVWPGRRDVLGALLSFSTVYVLTWTLILVWSYTEHTANMVAAAREEINVAQRQMEVAEETYGLRLSGDFKTISPSWSLTETNGMTANTLLCGMSAEASH